MIPKSAVFCVQHLLPSTQPLLRNIFRRLPADRYAVIGKDYSTVPAVVSSLAQDYGDRLDIDFGAAGAATGPFPKGALMLDEGGGLHDQFASADARLVAGVEQTTAGLRSVWHYPTVLVCRSAAKLAFESQIIARGVIRKLESLDLLAGQTIGVIGTGALGGELAHRLAERGCSVKVYDKVAPRGALRDLYRPLPELLTSSSLVLGVTGRDCLASITLNCLPPSVTFASCSSRNVEFATILRQLTTDGKYGSARGVLGAATVTVLNGGYPINFDRQTEWETPDEIWLTRQLCFAGLKQADGLIGTEPRGVMLDPAVQARLVHDWLERVPEPQTLRMPPRLDEDYFRTRSEGEIHMSKKPPYKLHETTPGALAQMRAHTEPYEVEVMGLSIVVLPNVWSPRYDWSSAFYIENFPEVEGRSFLEIGSGSGVISVYAGLNGATRVLAVDVNPDAVRNTRLNFERHGLGQADAILSEGFDQVKGQFDIVTWNAPYHGNRPEDPLERGCSDDSYLGIRAFFRDVGTHLAAGGSIVFGFSESGDLPLIRDLIREAGYRVKREFSDWRQEYNCMLMELVHSEFRPLLP